MGFFKDFKNDLSQAVNELVADDELKEMMEKEEKEKLPKVEGDVVEPDSEEDMELLKQLIAEDVPTEEKEPVEMEETLVEDPEDSGIEEAIEAEKIEEEEIEEMSNIDELDDITDEKIEEPDINELLKELSEEPEVEETEELGDIELDEDITAAAEEEKTEESVEEAEKEATKDALRGKRNTTMEKNELTSTASQSQEAPADEVTEITKGTAVDGNIIAEGSMNVYGKIKGNVACRGKLVICGTVVGASRAAEVYTNNAKVDGDVTSDGSIKVGNGSIIIGNVYGTSAVIAGAVKGDIDVHGPVIIDGTAVVQGNIRSRSVQINNGAAIEGAVSQCYAEIDYVALFDRTFAEQ